MMTDSSVAHFFAAVLKSWRADHDMTLAILAEKSGLSVSYISDIEYGRTMLSIDTIARLCNVFNMKPSVRFAEVSESTLDDQIAGAQAELEAAEYDLEVTKENIKSLQHLLTRLRNWDRMRTHQPKNQETTTND